MPAFPPHVIEEGDQPPPPGEPSLREIWTMAAEIRDEWSEYELRARRGSLKPWRKPLYRIPKVRTPKLDVAGVGDE